MDERRKGYDMCLFVAGVIVLFLMACYILNDACGTSSVKALSCICYSMDVFFFILRTAVALRLE